MPCEMSERQSEDGQQHRPLAGSRIGVGRSRVEYPTFALVPSVLRFVLGTIRSNPLMFRDDAAPMSARDLIFSSIRRSLGVSGTEATRRKAVADRLAQHPTGIVPARGLRHRPGDAPRPPSGAD